MKYVKQFLMIMLFTFFGEVLREVLPLPVPASIYGLVLMFVALLTGVLKVEKVRETGKFLIEIMPLMFIPAAAGLIDAWPSLKPVGVPIVVIMVVSTVIVMVLSGRVTQFMMRRKKKSEGGQQ